MQEMSEKPFQSPSQEDPLEKGMAAHSITLAWRLPRTEETVVGFSPQGCKESDTTEVTTHTFTLREQNRLGSCKTEDLGVQNLPTAAHNNPRIIHLTESVNQSRETLSNLPRAICMLVQLLSHVWLCNSKDCSPPGSSVHGILRARVLRWVDFFLCLPNCRWILTT